MLARIVGKRLGNPHQPFIIENRPGSGGNIAAEQASHAAPDGYTLLIGNNSILATNAALYKNLAYDPEKDFIPVSLIGTQANILVVNPAVQAHSMAELIALAKPSRESSILRPPDSAPRRIWPASCSRPRTRSTSSMCPTRARRRRSGRHRRPLQMMFATAPR